MSALRTLRHRFGQPDHDRSPESRIVVLVRALLLFESALYSAVTPVLPHYAHTLGASKPAVGVLAAAYPAGMLPGSLIAVWIATRAGVRRTTLVGLLVFAVSIVAFGFGTNLVTLDALRFVQGAACGCIWGGGLTWVIAVTARERRGRVLGEVIGAAIFGTLLGPILGTLAVTVGTQLVFSLVGATSLALAAWTARHHEPAPAQLGATTPFRAVLHNRQILLGAWLIVLEAGTIGATGTLIPLRLARFGAAGWEIGATFLMASLVSALLAPWIGRLVDRRGTRLPLCAGLAGVAVLLALMPLPQAWLGLAVICVITLGVPLTANTIPSIAIITNATERAGIALVAGTTMLNLAWATGETIGAPAAAGVSQATSDAVPLLALAAIVLLTLGVVMRSRFASAPPEPASTAAAVPGRSEDLPPIRAEQRERVSVG